MLLNFGVFELYENLSLGATTERMTSSGISLLEEVRAFLNSFAAAVMEGHNCLLKKLQQFTYAAAQVLQHLSLGLSYTES